MALYLVTGGCGFIGSHLLDALLAGGARVRVLDDLSTGTLANKPAGVELWRGDIADGSCVEAALSGVDGCFHLAAVASVVRGHEDWLGCHRTNLTGTVTVLEKARRARGAGPVPVVYASSAAVYGDASAGALGETAETRPLSAYGADKLGCELHARVAAHVHGVPTFGLRFFNVFGPRQDAASPYSGVVAVFCERLRAGRAIRIHGDGGQTRDFLYVGDAVRALLAAMDRPAPDGAVVNICSGRSTSVLELAATVAELCGSTPEIEYAPPRRGEIRASLGDPRRAAQRLGWQARTPLRDGLAATLGLG